MWELIICGNTQFEVEPRTTETFTELHELLLSTRSYLNNSVRLEMIQKDL